MEDAHFTRRQARLWPQRASLTSHRPVSSVNALGVSPSRFSMPKRDRFCRTKISTTFRCSPSQARCNAVSPLVVSATAQSAPAATSATTTSALPTAEARMSGVDPHASLASTGAPASTSMSTITFDPRFARQCSGVLRVGFLTSAEATNLTISAGTPANNSPRISADPHKHAVWIGENPPSSLLSTAMPTSPTLNRRNNPLTNNTAPCATATCNKVLPSSSTSSHSTPSSLSSKSSTSKLQTTSSTDHSVQLIPFETEKQTNHPPYLPSLPL
mmetsp:Transcript_9072/g.18356  ORF Transcript_9072/g.18356 Transcript_9072/m.18356 type:complete len:272 (-) Transcript_9072:68-883(-)